jgi:uncharacterized protein
MMRQEGLDRRRAFRSLLVLVIGIAAAGGTALGARAQARKRILMVTHTAGFRHDSIPVGEETVKELGERTGLWEVDYARNADEVQKAFTADNLRRYALVFFGNTTGELPITDEGKAAFLEWLRSGKGFVGVHAATDTFYRWPEYGKMIGGYFNGHPWHQKVVVRVEDQQHPATRHLGRSFEITDEIYQFKQWERGDKRVLLSIDPSSVNLSKGARPDNDYAVAWVRAEVKGRVFYTSLGHRQEVWRDPRFQEHLVGGLRWALGLEPGSTTPLPAPRAAPPRH